MVHIHFLDLLVHCKDIILIVLLKALHIKKFKKNKLLQGTKIPMSECSVTAKHIVCDRTIGRYEIAYQQALGRLYSCVVLHVSGVVLC